MRNSLCSLKASISDLSFNTEDRDSKGRVIEASCTYCSDLESNGDKERWLISKVIGFWYVGELTVSFHWSLISSRL